ncbi:hypothetical protein LTR09_001514 [Extremus antarcticus]|uniref:Uncharacterized protein n=1 Tax=Extremus antarcticus TaxID=702011 RepID=A0AAJ0LVY5_9PEZI|nr:hypothetical protein LTR09_001514 [Extremus antarcticus]
MMKDHRKGDDASHVRSRQTAKELLGHAELPLIIRARACMILGCGTESGYLDMRRRGCGSLE